MQDSQWDTLARSFIEMEFWLLDDGKLLEWLALFDDPCSYWIPVDPQQEQPGDGAALVNDGRFSLEARVRHLLDRRTVASAPPSRVCRILGASRCNRTEEGLVHVQAKNVTVESRITQGAADIQRVFAGTSTYVLVPNGDSYKIRQKRVDLVNSETSLLGVFSIL